MVRSSASIPPWDPVAPLDSIAQAWEDSRTQGDRGTRPLVATVEGGRPGRGCRPHADLPGDAAQQRAGAGPGLRGTGRGADIGRGGRPPGAKVPLHHRLLPGDCRDAAGRERELPRLPRRELLHPADRLGRRAHHPGRLAAGDPPLHRVPPAVPREPGGPMAAQPGPHDAGRASGQGRTAIPHHPGSIPQLWSSTSESSRDVPAHTWWASTGSTRPAAR